MAPTSWPVKRVSSLFETMRGNETVFTLSFMIVFIMIGFGMVSPVLPLFGRSFGVSSAMVGMLVTAFGLARLFTNIPAGRLADRIGRRPLLVASPLIISVGAVMAGFAPTFWLLVAARFVQGVGSAIFATASMTCLADVSTPETRGRVMATYQGSLLIGTSFGPTFGGLTGHALGINAVFFVYGLIALLAGVWAFLRIKETLPGPTAPQRTDRTAPETRRGRAGTWALLANPSFLAVCMVSLVIFFTRTGSRSTILPLISAERLGMTESTIGFMLTVAAICNVLTLPFAAWGIDRFGRKTMIVPSLTVSALAIILFASVPDQAIFFLAAGLLGIGTGIAGPAPAAYATDLARGQNYGATMGLFRTMSDLGFVIGPVLLGFLADHRGFSFALYVNAVLLLAVTALFTVTARESRVARTAQPATAGVSDAPAGKPAED